MLKDLIKNLKVHNKIMVTGPYRSGTTIAGKIIAEELGYKYIDEIDYGGGDIVQLMIHCNNGNNVVIQNTSFFRDIHFLTTWPNEFAIVLVKRNVSDILDSWKRSKDLKNEHRDVGMFDFIDKRVIKKHFGFCDPKLMYDHFESKNKSYYVVKYNSLKKHKLFVDRKFRRTNFKHLKQTEVII